MLSQPEKIAVLGATGSIGQSTLDIIARHPERFELYAVSAFTQLDKLVEVCQSFQPRYAVLAKDDRALFERLQTDFNAHNITSEILMGADALVQIAQHEAIDTLVAAIVGAAGLASSLAAAKAGKKILLANKESLVMAGPLFMNAVKANNATLLPIDSEHNAIFQCLPQEAPSVVNKAEVCKVLLTASGGPFREKSLDEMQDISVAQAIAHPNWSMGKKISIDSATLMNKGLELIEACWLFDIKPEDIEVVVHPESIIHSMVQYVDGTTLAQMGQPDMRTPIANALAWPARIAAGVERLDLFAVANLNFEVADTQRFPNLALAAKAFELGGAAPAILNAANEVAVDAFLQQSIGFVHIAAVNATVLEELAKEHAVPQFTDLDALMQIDHTAREVAHRVIRELS